MINNILSDANGLERFVKEGHKVECSTFVLDRDVTINEHIHLHCCELRSANENTYRIFANDTYHITNNWFNKVSFEPKEPLKGFIVDIKRNIIVPFGEDNI